MQTGPILFINVIYFKPSFIRTVNMNRNVIVCGECFMTMSDVVLFLSTRHDCVCRVNVGLGLFEPVTPARALGM